jgi:hypothetical protein
VINDRVDNSGVDHIDMNTLVTGNATDSDGASYVFNYHNHQSIEIPVGGLPFQVTANDHFNLNGRGRANQVHVGFVVRLTFTGPSDPPDVEVVSLRGDPEHCDGL